MKKCSLLIKYQQYVQCVAFLSKDSDLIVSGYCQISCFSTKSGDIVWNNRSFGKVIIKSIDVSPNKDIVAAGGGFDKCLSVINAANGDSICSIDVGSWINRVLFLSQKNIACGLYNGTVTIVCWQTQKIVKILKLYEIAVYALALSPVNNDILLVGGCSVTIKQTIISSEKTVMEYEHCHTGAVCDLKFLSCGNMFVSCSDDWTARLFSLCQKQSIRVFHGHVDEILYVSLIHNDELLITASLDNTVKVWNIDSGECLSSTETDYNISCANLSKDETHLVVGGKGEAVLFKCPPRFAVSLDRKLKLSK